MMNRSVLITGGTGSVGRALVAAFSEAHYNVTFQFHSQVAVARDIGDRHKCTFLQFDLAQSHMPEGEFDILVNNAAVNLSNHCTIDCSEQELMETLAINLLAPFRLTRHFLPRMQRQGWGRIINISSIYGLHAGEGNCPYTISKHGLSGLTKTVAKEYASLGVTCNEICPGPIKGDLMLRIANRSYSPEFHSPQEYLAAVAAEVPAKRMAQPEEIAALALFLASNEAQYINGASIPIDGGLIA